MKDKQAREEIEEVKKAIDDLTDEVLRMAEVLDRLTKRDREQQSKFRTHDG